MYTPAEFVTELVVDGYRLFVIFVTEVLFGVDPLTAISGILGAILVGVSVLVFGYLALGAAAGELGIGFPSLGRSTVGPPPADREGSDRG